MNKRISSLIVITTILLLFIHLIASAVTIVSSGNCGVDGNNIIWELDSDGILTVSGVGEMSLQDANIDKSAKKVIVNDGVMNIGFLAFANSGNLTRVEMSDSVIKIGSGAFSKCINLSDITFSDNLTEIGQNAFDSCNIKELIMPDTITDIWSWAFIRCGNLKKVNLSSGLSSIGTGVFQDCNSLESITIPTGVKEIKADAFKGCENLTDVYYEGTTAEWGSISISTNNEYLTNAKIHCMAGDIPYQGTCGKNGDNVIWTLDDSGTLIISGTGEMQGGFVCSHDIMWEFYTKYREKIKTVIIENGVTNVSDYAFSGCSLTNITIGSDVASIATTAFEDCYNLTNISVNSENEFYSSENGILFNKEKTKLIIYPNRKSERVYTIPDDAESIGNLAFFGCTELTSLVIPPSVMEIGDMAYGFYEYGQFFYGKGYTGYPATIYGCVGSTAETYVNNSSESWYEPQITFVAYETNNNKVTIKNCTPYDNGSGGLTILSMVNGCPVTEICENAFVDCSKLTDVYYDGNEDEWNSLTIGNGNEYLLNANIHYNSIMPFFVREYNKFLYIVSNGEATITKCKEYTDYIEIPSEIDGIPVTEIGSGVFNTDAVKSIMIPSSVTSIDRYAFSNCENLIDVYYDKTVSDWGNILIEEGNNYLSKAALHTNAIGTASPKIATTSIVGATVSSLASIAVTLEKTEYDSTMITAFYKDGVMVDTVTTPISAGDADKSVPITAGDSNTAKVFIWSSLDSIKPLCVAETINLNVTEK